MNDKEVADFIVNGYHVIDSGLPEKFHADLVKYSNTKDIGRFNSHNPGNNVLPVIPSLEYVFEAPPVRGALTSILGKDYMMHPHRHPHNNAPGFKAQQFHKDSFFGYELPRHHYPIWVMAMYYPQDTTIELGPTGISPTSQYLSLQDTKKRHIDVTTVWPVKDLAMECKKGTVILIHYDLWHKGTANVGPINRFMFKFQFQRMTPPLSPTWNNTSPEYPLSSSPHPLSPLHLQMWKWLRGDHSATKQKEVKEEKKTLFDNLRNLSVEGEVGRLSSSYTLAHDINSIDGLIDLIHSEHQCVRRSALYGLSSNRNEEVAMKVAETINRGKNPFAAEVALALGDFGSSALGTLPQLFFLLGSPKAFVRTAAIEAIGLILYSVDETDSAKSGFLNQATWQEDLYKALKPLMEDREEEVRFSTCLTVARLGRFTNAASRFVYDLEKCATVDQNRYVRGYALEALGRIQTPESNKVTLRILKSSHYCAVTTSESTF